MLEKVMETFNMNTRYMVVDPDGNVMNNTDSDNAGHSIILLLKGIDKDKDVFISWNDLTDAGYKVRRTLITQIPTQNLDTYELQNVKG